MRVLLCKLKCLSICLSDKSSHRLESPSSLKLEDAQHSSSSSPVLEGQSTAAAKIDETQKNESSTDGKVKISVKSSIKKSSESESESEEEAKGRVKWMDFVGKELVEIREFESIDSGESEDEDSGNQSCACFTQ